MKWGHDGDYKGGLKLNDDDVEMLEIMMVGIKSLTVPKLACQLYSM